MISSSLPLPRTRSGDDYIDDHPVQRSQSVRIGDVGFLTFSSSLSGLASLWRDFEEQAICTPYQRYDWLRLWQHHIGEADGMNPVIGILSDNAGGVRALLPFGLDTHSFMRTATWLGDKHANYFMGLFHKDTVLKPSDCHLILSALAKQFGIDAFVLKNQPRTWFGFNNPFFGLPSQPSPSQAYSATLSDNYDAFFEARPSGRWKRQLRSKAKKLAQSGSVEVLHVTNCGMASSILETYFEQKYARLEQQGIRDPFSDDRVRGFFRALVCEQDEKRPLLELYALTCQKDVIAIYAGSSFHGRFSASICSIADTPLKQFSPGEQLLAGLIEDRCKRGDRMIDLGIGEGRYKAHWCPDSDELFDTFLPITRTGKVAIGIAAGKRRIKRVVKQNPELWSAFQRIRALKSRT